MRAALRYHQMNLSYVQKLLLTADPFAAIRTNFRGWKGKLKSRRGKTGRKRLRGRHLTCAQRGDISSDLQDSATGPVTMIATTSDKEAICYEGEIANVLEETGFNVEIDNAKSTPSEEQTPTGVEMTVKDKTVRPVHAYRIVQAFRKAGVAIATRINARRANNNTLYITVGPNVAPGLVPLAPRNTSKWQGDALRTLLGKWKTKFSTGLRRPGQTD